MQRYGNGCVHPNSFHNIKFACNKLKNIHNKVPLHASRMVERSELEIETNCERA